jgi:hypothetical protein
MKTNAMLLFLLAALVSLSACEDEADNTTISGDPSPMGEVGTTFSSSSSEIAGISNFDAVVTSNASGVSTLTATAVVTDPLMKNILSNSPEITFNGDTATVMSAKFKITKDGIAYLSGDNSGIIVRYGSSVGDIYPIGNTGDQRVVVSKSTDDDFFYGFLLIKVIQVEEESKDLRDAGIEKLTYWANHRFGLVAIEMTFGDGSTARFPVYCSAEN